MNEKDLAAWFVKLAELREQCAAIEEQIRQAVLEIGESRKIAGITAIHYAETVEKDYESLAKEAGAPDDLIEKFTSYTPRPKWQAICDAMGIVVIPEKFCKVKPARVVIK